MSMAEGSDHQDVRSYQYIETGDGEFDGPYVLDAEFSLERVTVAARGGYRLNVQWVFEGIVGAGLLRQSFEAEGRTGLRVEDDETLGEAFIGGRLSWYPVPALGLYGQYTGGTLGPRRILETAEGGLLLGPYPGVALLLGYRRWTYREGHDESSDITVKLGGPVVGLRLEF